MLKLIAFISIIIQKFRADLSISCELFLNLGVNLEITHCNNLYMNQFCNFGIPPYISDSFSESAFYFSDCYLNCFEKDCNVSLLQNGICDESCNFAECGWDGGDCGVCSSVRVLGC